MEEIMGSTGAYLLITAVTMALMSTGSGEVMAVSSILVYDIYKTYINPFRKTATPTCCQLCGKEKVSPIIKKTEAEEIQQLCACVSADNCKDCADDIMLLIEGKKSYDLRYNCQIHGLYRHYEDLLIDRKGWCIVWVTIAIVPYGLIIISSGVNLNWAVFTMQSLISPFLTPLLLTIAWSKSTSAGVIAGSVTGLVAAIAGILIVAGTVYSDLKNNFLKNTSSDYSLLAGTVSGIVVSLVVTVVVSLATNKVKNSDESEREWEKTVSIDNPLNSWKRLYKEELSFVPTGTRITSQHMAHIFRSARLVAYIGGGFSLLLFIVILPSIMLSFEVLSYDQFTGFLKFTQVWCMIAAAFAIVVPPIEEIIQILREIKKNKTEKNLKHDGSLQANDQYGQSSRL
ncbi:hypothetical protein KUTeg_009344 [Tegillarca granosa]|uniref:Uncharacterized protein n=1 Tax=Tegillarca granosa TaxID=220873 RepID=A0ABQ9F5W1_TEGGR|nr:hypothetical protein KUTeg_009344 [Tegillarca granosa]